MPCWITPLKGTDSRRGRSRPCLRCEDGFARVQMRRRRVADPKIAQAAIQVRDDGSGIAVVSNVHPAMLALLKLTLSVTTWPQPLTLFR